MIAAHVEDAFPNQFLSWLCTLAVGTTVCLFLTGFEICWRIRARSSLFLYKTRKKWAFSKAEHCAILAVILSKRVAFPVLDSLTIEILAPQTVLPTKTLSNKSQGTTDGISSAPFHTGFLSGQLWLQYGLLRNDETVICVNSVAALLYSFYLLYYFMMASYAAKSRCIRLIFLEIIFLISAHYYIHYYGSPMEVIRSRLGMCCVIFNVLTVAAPLEALREVFRTRCTETMPLPLCCLTLLVTAEWLLYGILIDDIYIKVPNAVASVIAIAQLLPFFCFPRNKQIAVIIP